MLEIFMRPKVQGQFRHLLNTIGGVAATYGVLTEAQGIAIAGVVAALVAFGLSLFAPEKKP